MISLVGHLICACLAFKEDNIKKVFYNVSIIKLCYSGTILTFVVGLIIMVISPLPYWISAVACSLILIVNVISVSRASLAADLVNEMDEKIEASTRFIYSMRSKSSTLISKANGEGAKATAKAVRDAFVKSDPVSSDATYSVEYNISGQFEKFAKLISENADAKDLEAVAEQLIALVNERASICKVNK